MEWVVTWYSGDDKKGSNHVWNRVDAWYSEDGKKEVPE
jgi:hypothetical protein